MLLIYNVSYLNTAIIAGFYTNINIYITNL